METNRERAKKMMTHYFQKAWVKAGIPWDSDYTMEIGQMVDCLIAAAVDAMQVMEYVDALQGEQYDEEYNYAASDFAYDVAREDRIFGR